MVRTTRLCPVWACAVAMGTTLVGGLFALGLLAAPALAAGTTCSASGTTYGGTVTTTFSFTGAEQCLLVPEGVTQVTVTAIGGAGGTEGGVTVTAAAAADVVATIPVVAQETLYVEVGGNGNPSVGATGGAAQFGGGAGGGSSTGGYAGGGGGGASTVQTCSITSAGCVGEFGTG